MKEKWVKMKAKLHLTPTDWSMYDRATARDEKEWRSLLYVSSFTDSDHQLSWEVLLSLPLLCLFCLIEVTAEQPKRTKASIDKHLEHCLKHVVYAHSFWRQWNWCDHAAQRCHPLARSSSDPSRSLKRDRLGSVNSNRRQKYSGK